MASLRPLRFCSTTPHFFKIILEDTSGHKLKIPKKFVMKYGQDLSNSVFLKLPSGSEWEVELTRCKGKVWFEKGWPEFSMFCYLDYGSFVLFRYEGNSHFDVCIFDMSATEIDYPITMPKIEEADEDDDLPIEILEGLQPSPQTRRKCPLACPPYKKMRTSLSSKADVISEIENTQPCDMFEKPITNKESHRNKVEVENLENKEKDGRVPGGLSGTQRFLKKTSHKVLGNGLALHRAYDFKTENPSFVVSLQPSDIKSSLSLPPEFSRRHLIKQPASNITLRVLDGRIWSVEFTYTKEKALFQGGWLTFVKDNNLEVGDVCVFVLIKDIELLLGVFFFRTSEATTWFLSNGENGFPTEKDGGSSSSSQTILKRTHEVVARVKPLTAAEKANAFKSDKPSFRIAMHPYSIHYNYVYLPNEFAKTYLTKLSSGIAILQVSDGRTWSVNFKFDHANSRARLMKGWSPFVMDNNLKVGDVCIFTLINCTELVFDVVFFPTEESAERPSSTGHGRGATVQVREMKHPLVKVESECGMNCEIGKNKMSNISGQVTQRPSSSLRTARINLEAASKFSSKNPFFKVTLGSGHTVHVPVHFARSFIKQEKQTVMLQVKDRLWPVSLISYKPCATSISQGWAAFAKENCLREGDVCIFELIEMNDIVLKGHIFRC